MIHQLDDRRFEREAGVSSIESKAGTVRVVFLVAIAIAMTGCASRVPIIDSSVVRVGERASTDWPAAVVAISDAPPRILRLELSSLRVSPGQQWRGRIATSTNVASVEIRTELFSFTAQRTAFGQFRFMQRIIDLPGIFQRGYVLRVIARNAAGAAVEQEIPFRLSARSQ